MRMRTRLPIVFGLPSFPSFLIKMPCLGSSFHYGGRETLRRCFQMSFLFVRGFLLYFI